MHRTNILPNIRAYFIISPVCLAHFLSSIEVGNASQCCSGSGQTNSQDDPPAQRRFDHSIESILGFPKRPRSPEADLYSRRNAAPTAMVQVGGWQKVTIFTRNRRPSWTLLTFPIYKRVSGDQYTKRKLKLSAFQNWFSRRIRARQC